MQPHRRSLNLACVALSLSLFQAPWISQATTLRPACLLLFPVALFTQAQPAAEEQPKSDEKLKQQVQRLVEQLDAAQLRSREQAQKQLEQLGPDILPLLPHSSPSQSAELQRRLSELRQKLERQKALEAAKAGRVTLRAQAMSLDEVIAAIAQQTGNPIGDYREEMGQPQEPIKLDLDFQDVSFWQAMDEVAFRGGLGLTLDTGQGDLGLVAGRPDRGRNPYVAYAGPIRLEPTEIELHRDLRGSGLAACVLTMDLMWEPRLRPIYLKHAAADVRAGDEEGKPVPTAERDAAFEMMPLASRPGSQLVITFQPPARSAHKIARLRGKLVLGIPAQLETFRFENLAKAKQVEVRRAGLTVTLMSIAQSDIHSRARILLTYDAADEALESYRMGWLTHNEIFLEDPDGERFELNGGFNPRGFGKNSAEIEYIFVDVPGKLSDYTLVYRSPGMILELPIEYELTDLPLP